MANFYREFDEETGISIVEITDKLGVSRGRARAHEEDLDLVSEKTGLTIAEYKARIERERRRIVRAEETVEKAQNTLDQALKYKQQREEHKEELENYLDLYLKNKEEFRKNYRKNLAKRQIPTKKN